MHGPTPLEILSPINICCGDLFGLWFHSQHAFFKLKAGHHYNSATTGALYLYVSAGANYLPVVASTGMLLFHTHRITQGKLFSFHCQTSPIWLSVN